MKEYLKDNLIIIGPSYMKKEILSDNILNYNIKIIDEYELKDKYLYSYKDSVLTYTDKKYNNIPEISNVILNNLYQIDINKSYSTNKLNKLVEIKKDLIDNDYIVENNYFKKYLNNKDILVIDANYDSITSNIIESLKVNNNVTYVENNQEEKDNIDIHEFNTLEDEVAFTASLIVDLINKGISIDKIKLNKLSNDYKTTYMHIFDAYGIPYQETSNNLYYLEDTKILLNSLNDNTTIIEINDIINELNINELIKNKIINIFNKYVDYDRYGDIKDEILYEIKNTSISLVRYNNVIEQINYKNYKPSDDEYIFMLGINQEEIPVIYKDNSYLSDKELKEINSDTSYDLNMKENNYFKKFINETKNIILSYKINSNFNNFMASNILKEMNNVNIIKEDYKYDNKEINRIVLAKRLDNYAKYGEISEDLPKLYYYYNDIDYNSYDNQYNGIDIDTIKKQLDNKINLSYTNTSTFFRCKFRFLLDNIYKLAPYEETISQNIGNLFHDVLCTVYEKNIDADEVINEKVELYFKEHTNKELFYVEKYKKALKKLIQVLNEQLSKSMYKNEYFEEWFSVEKERDIQFKIVGKIDKILTLKDGINTYVIVVDYKTGSMHGDFNKVIHGFDMQLLYYLYLIRNSDKIKYPRFTGMYLQSIMSEILSSEKGKKYEDLVKENMKLFGYTINDAKEIQKIDKDYEDNSYIRGIRVKKDGTFYAYSKVLSEDTINSLIDIVEKNLEEVMESISNADFAINPKKMGNEIDGCEYCPFKDICYMNNDNIVELEAYKNLEFLGGDISDTE